ncbi:D-alanyl-D-alanine carboxypeptidase family protein [Paenibacillus glufosinatiresistens]|uniref:D-alanyl-D-alanine carboxypeptidase family protein n=1 Tax=Paenibacillus glufosinatiresistens TaxID=3070657 RepID=UPI0038CD8873
MPMNRWITKWAALLGILALLLPPGAVSAGGVSTQARAAALIDVESGRILYSHNGDEPMLIASLTKIMTAIVAIENGKLDSVVKVGKNAYAKEGSSIYLRQGEEMTLETMLYGLMLRSGNDAATAIAEHVGGSEEGFVHLMNAKAELLGLKHTHFANPHGLDAEGHYSTANDLAVLTAYALHNPVFKEIVKTRVKTADNPNEPWDYKWSNKNKMLRLYEGADGVKTGYTKKALRCLVSSATRSGQQLVAVTLNDGNDWNDHMAMLDFGFSQYPLKRIVERGDRVEGYALAAGTGFAYPLKAGEAEKLKTQLVLESGAGKRAKVQAEGSAASGTASAQGTSADTAFGLRGRLVLTLGGREIGRVPVYDPDRLPPEAQPFGSVRSSSAGVHPAKSWSAALADALRVLLTVRPEGGEAG